MPRRCSFKLELEFPQPLAGVDEAGCAPLAGPVVAAACILDRDKFPRGIDDSKNLPIEGDAVPAALYALIIYITSVASGWHYATDGLVGAALATAIYALLSRRAQQAADPEKTISEREPALA